MEVSVDRSTADGDFTDLAGHKLVGREAIEKNFTELFAENKGLKLRIDGTGLRFATAEVAIEDGNHVGDPPGRPAAEPVAVHHRPCQEGR